MAVLTTTSTIVICEFESDRNISFGGQVVIYTMDTDKYWKVVRNTFIECSINGLIYPLTNEDLRATPLPITGSITATVDEVSVVYKKEALDLFGLLQTGSPQSLFDAQFTYGLQPLLYAARNNGGSIAHSATERCAVFTGAANATPYMQSYEYIRYQPAKMQKIFLTGNFNGGETDTVKYFQYGDSTNAISVQCLANGDLNIKIITSTSEGNQEVTVDPATFGINMNKENIMVINFEALYVGTVKVQFQIGREAIDVAIFDNANETDYPYIATANLPIKVGMTCGASAGTPTMLFNCVSVQTVGGQEDTLGYPFNAYSGLISAASGTRTHLLSLQPRLLFNSFENRTKFVLESVDFIVTGNSPVFFELGIGQALTGDAWSNVNTTHSAMEKSLGTISGSATMYFEGALLASSATVKSSSNSRTVLRMPITLDDLGAQRLNGRLSAYGTGQGGASNCGVKFNWKEIY
jgi:hypothetical protein